MSLYKKFNFQVPDVDISRIKGPIQNSYGGNKLFPKIAYYNIKDMDYFNSCFPAVCKVSNDTLFYTEILGGSTLVAHTDHGVQCCINYYLEPNNSTTYFYDENGVLPSTYPGKTTANIYDVGNIILVDKFVAKKNDCYLLDVSKIHSVSSPDLGKRCFITWQWNHELFDTISDNLISNY